MQSQTIDIPPEKIQPNPQQPRTHFDQDELALLGRSLVEHKQIQPIVNVLGRVRLEAKMIENQKIRTTPNFWDCACEHAYIHYHTVPHCARCGAYREDQPDSRENKVETHLVEIMDEVLKRCGDALSDLQQMCVGQDAPADLRFPVVLFLRPAHLVFHLQAAFQTAVRQAAAELASRCMVQEEGDG